MMRAGKPGLRVRQLVLILVALLILPLRAAAGDGTWTQFDLSKDGELLVANAERGRQVYGLVAGKDGDEAWLAVSLLRTWAVGDEAAPWKLRAGTGLKVEKIGVHEVMDYRYRWCDDMADDCKAARAGVRLQAERWKSYDRVGLYLMADYNSIAQARLAVAGLTHLKTGLGGQLSVYDDDEGDTVPAVMLSAPIRKTGLSVRLGHKPTEKETFVGVSFSTY